MIGSAGGNNPALCYYVATAAILGLFALYDFRSHKVRNLALLWFIPWCFISLPIYAHTTDLPLGLLILKAVFGFLNGGLVLLITAMATNGGVGGGDIKLTALLGFVLGTTRICILLIGACTTALFVVLIKGLINSTQNRRFPFVPFLFAGMLLTILL